MDNKILITGGTGFIASYLAMKLSEVSGDEIIGRRSGQTGGSV
jgi:nucleoside-diphosphate-sugar epimerase